MRLTRPTGEQVEVDARPTGPEDSGRPIIILEGATSSPENRSFNPAANDKSGIISVAARFRNAPEGSRLRWSSPEAGALQVDTPNSGRTRVRGLRPGRRDLDVELLDAGGTRIASMKLRLSVPQYVRIVEDPSFNTFLADSHLSPVKNPMIAHVKQTAEHLLRRANVRLFWQVGGMNEQVPAHVPAASVMTVTLRNTDPGGALGRTNQPVAPDRFDEAIDLFPDHYDDQDAIDVDTETQALILELESSLASDPGLEQLGAKVFGRLIGETMAHEVVHGLIADLVNPGHATDPYHHIPAVANDLMNPGGDRVFRQRTGMENTAQVSPVQPSHYVDHGLATIGGLQPVTQALVDSHFPVAGAMP